MRFIKNKTKILIFPLFFLSLLMSLVVFPGTALAASGEYYYNDFTEIENRVYANGHDPNPVVAVNGIEMVFCGTSGSGQLYFKSFVFSDPATCNEIDGRFILLVNSGTMEAGTFGPVGGTADTVDQDSDEIANLSNAPSTGNSGDPPVENPEAPLDSRGDFFYMAPPEDLGSGVVNRAAIRGPNEVLYYYCLTDGVFRGLAYSTASACETNRAIGYEIEIANFPTSTSPGVWSDRATGFTTTINLVVDSDYFDEDLVAATEQAVEEIGCRAENFGWIICPVVDGLLNFVDMMAGLIGNFLAVSPVELDSNAPTYQMWQVFRNISLSLLVVAMLVMVFGQALSLNIDAYTVKKMLPRIAIAAIGVMLSIYVAAFAVDFFNVLGKGVSDLVTAPFGDVNIFVGSFGNLTGVLLAGIAGGTIIYGLGIAGFVMVILIPVALAFLSVYLTLVLRQIVIIMLVIIAPLAFVAWTVPGTERYFKMWGSTLVKALMMYPLIMLLLASGQVFAVIITNVPSGQPGWINTLTALVALALPLFLVPATFKLAGGAIAMGSGALANMQAKTKQRLADPNDRLGRNLKKYRGIHDQKKDSDRAMKAMGFNKKATDGMFKKGYRNIRQLGAAGSLLATGAGRSALVKDAYAAIGQSEQEMEAQMQRNPYAFQSYLEHGSSKASVEAEARRLRDNGNEAQASQLEQLASTFGYGNQAAAGAMLMSMGKIGKLTNGAIDGAARTYGATTDNDGVTRFGAHQASAAATFGNIATQAGFAAAGASISQAQYKNLAVVGASAVGDSGKGFVVNRNGNAAAKEGGAEYFRKDDEGYSGESKADWATMSANPAIPRTDNKALETMSKSVEDHVNYVNPTTGEAHYTRSAQQAMIRSYASAARFGSTPEIMEQASKTAEGFRGTANNTQIAQLNGIAQADQAVRTALVEAKNKGLKTTPELTRAQANLAAAQAAMPDASNFVQIAGEWVESSSPRHDYLAEFNRGERVIPGASGL